MFQNIQELFERTLKAESRFAELVELVEELFNNKAALIPEDQKANIRALYE